MFGEAATVRLLHQKSTQKKTSHSKIWNGSLTLSLFPVGKVLALLHQLLNAASGSIVHTYEVHA